MAHPIVPPFRVDARRHKTNNQTSLLAFFISLLHPCANGSAVGGIEPDTPEGVPILRQAVVFRCKVIGAEGILVRCRGIQLEVVEVIQQMKDFRRGPPQIRGR